MNSRFCQVSAWDLSVLATAWCCWQSVAWGGELTLVENGRAQCAVLVAGKDDGIARAAAADLQGHLQRAGGAAIPLIREDAAQGLPAGTVRLVVGASRAAAEAGLRVQGLGPGEYRIKTAGNQVFILGQDDGEWGAASGQRPGTSPATLYAVAHLLDRHLGARWLWPGELGTLVPKRQRITLPDLDLQGRQPLEKRVLRIAVLSDRHVAPGISSPEILALVREQARLWCAHHQLGLETNLHFGHSFMTWWDKYHAGHPDYFALPPPGKRQVAPDRVKLCVSNPAVADQVLAEWKAAGQPDVWNVCPNDGSGFCTCERCRDWDGAGPQDPERIWGAQANLTGRYLRLWNSLLERMKADNPQAKLCSYAYSAYRNPPAGARVESGLVLGFVHTYWAQPEWSAWSSLGAKLVLRPNWWHTGAVAPHLPLHRTGEFFRFARDNGMLGFDFDSLLGFWATQGPNYYLIARLAARPELSVEDVIGEYCSAFGAAAPVIQRYLDFWEEFTGRAAYAVPAGGTVSQDPAGLYETACRKLNTSTHPLSGSWAVLPHLYRDEALAPAFALLDEARRAASEADPEALGRIGFLRDGLVHLQAIRDVVALGAIAKPGKEQKEETRAQVKRLLDLQRELTPRHVVWGDVVLRSLQRRPIQPFGQGKRAVSLDGL